MSSEEDRDQFDPELDLLNRYDQMIATQIEIINGIDDKAAFTGRLIGLLGGLILTAISVVAGTDTIESSVPTAASLVLLAIGVLALFVSLVLAIITYLSSKFAYGPTAGLGKFMAEHQVDPQQYRDALLDGYSEAIVDNRRVVQRNARRFKYCLTALLVPVFGWHVVRHLRWPRSRYWYRVFYHRRRRGPVLVRSHRRVFNTGSLTTKR